jgi:hypothetical protein
MQKYIQDSLRNNLRPIISSLSLPQQRAVTEMVRGLFTAQRPILRAMAQYQDISVKKQADKYTHHLGNINIKQSVDDLALRKARKQLTKDTIIAYDLTDIEKEDAKKMEGLHGTWDGSKKKPSQGYMVHGVGMNSLLLKLQAHEADEKTLPQVRAEIMAELIPKLDGKGIWVYDRGNDSNQLLYDLRQYEDVRFILRIKENRRVVMKKSGVIINVQDLLPGVYEVYLFDRHGKKVDQEIGIITLVIHKHLEHKEPIRLVTNLQWKRYGVENIVAMYLDRWGIENTFKRAKTKFNLEDIRVLSWQKFVNLISMIQFALLVCSTTFLGIQKSTNQLIIGVIMLYHRFLKQRCLTSNLDSFITYLQFSLKTFQQRPKKLPSVQVSLFTRDELSFLE